MLQPFLALISSKSISDIENNSVLFTTTSSSTFPPKSTTIIPIENVTHPLIMKIPENEKKNRSIDDDDEITKIEGSEVLITTSTTEDPKSLLIPPAFVEAQILQMNTTKKASKLQT